MYECEVSGSGLGRGWTWAPFDSVQGKEWQLLRPPVGHFDLPLNFLESAVRPIEELLREKVSDRAAG